MPYSVSRTKEEVEEGIAKEIAAHPRYILTGVTINWSEEILSTIKKVFWLKTGTDERVSRVKDREEKRWGDRVAEGGDMHEQQKSFRDLIAGFTDEGEDKDLAAHFTIINHRGRCLCGAPIKEIFDDVPIRDYIDSIWNDIADAEDEITDNPMYIILNLARVLAYVKDGLVLSKKEGGEWALDNIPEVYHSLLHNALKEYAEGMDTEYDMNNAENYAVCIVEQIRSEMKRVEKTWN